jgi:hypothetical protein
MSTKSETVTFRIRPEIKGALREAAEQERRSLANMLEIMISDWCEHNGVGSGTVHTDRRRGDPA